MKLLILILLNAFLMGNIYSQELTVNEKKKLAEMEDSYSAGLKVDYFNYASLLYRTDEISNYLKADSVLNYGISLQDHDPESITYGQWNWTWRDHEKIVDFNRALFNAEKMFVKLWEQQGKMSKETKENFISSCKDLTEAAVRRWDTEVFDIGRDFVNYSNIFALYVETLTLAGERFYDFRLRKMAKSQWTRWYNHISYFGIDEFASPTYNNVVFKALKNIHDFSPEERIKQETLEVMDHIYLLQSALTHPTLKIPITGISRDYRSFLIEADARSTILTSSLEDNVPVSKEQYRSHPQQLVSSLKDYFPPQKAISINENRTYPFEVRGKAAIAPFLFKSYQLEDAGMGTMTGGLVFWQQINCMIAVGKNENERAVAFAQGTNNPINGYTDQIETSALLVYNRLPTYWHTTQWRGDMSTYKETFDELGIGVSQNWKEKKKTKEHIILGAYGYDLHIFPFIIEDEKMVSSELGLRHRTTSSERYHPRDRNFDEYVFPLKSEWFGAYISLVKSGEEVDIPGLIYSNDDGIRTFKTNSGHKVRLFVTEKGETKQLHNVDPALIPVLEIMD